MECNIWKLVWNIAYKVHRTRTHSENILWWQRNMNWDCLQTVLTLIYNSSMIELFDVKLYISHSRFYRFVEIARLSKSPWSTPLNVVPKKRSEEWKPGGEYHASNARTLPDSVQHIQDHAHILQGNKIFSTLDLVRAYNQIPLVEEDVAKTAITRPFRDSSMRY